jgi:hypothetical protein
VGVLKGGNMRKIKTFERRLPSDEVRKAIVYYHADWQEYFVRFYRDDKYQHNADYFASDREDAIGTADYFVNREP